jgi:hypothetical protein
MKAKIVPLITATAISLLASAATHASSVHLICRGGHTGNTNMSFTSVPTTDGMETIVYYHFVPFKGTKSQVKRDGSHLHPGECSWATDVLSSKYNTLIYYISPSDVSQQTNIYMSADSANNAVYDEFTVINVDPTDPLQSFIPPFNGLQQSPDEIAGTILDENAIFNWYVTIDQFNHLVLQHL